MPFPESLKARRGEPILPKWLQLQEWAKSFRLFTGSQVRLEVTPDGTWVNLVSRHFWDYAFRVTISNLQAKIGFGMVDGDLPRIGEARIDGTDMEFAPLETGVPRLDLSDGVQDSGRSFIAIQVTLPEGEDQPDREDPEGLQIVHAPEIALDQPLEPIAVLYWSAGRVVKHLPIGRFDRKFHMFPATEMRGAEYFFRAA